jgi:DNA invertase Pin-like site-specific DNA recombinase
MISDSSKVGTSHWNSGSPMEFPRACRDSPQSWSPSRPTQFWSDQQRVFDLPDHLQLFAKSVFADRLHQQGLDTRSPSGKAMFGLMSVFAEFERAMIQERVRAGLARARSEGKTLGRPRIAEKTERAILAALSNKDRPGVRQIAASIGVGVGTVQRVARELRWCSATSG